MSSASEFFGANIDTSRTGYIATGTLSTGTGEDLRYFDVTISAVQDVNKCRVVFNGAFSSNAGYADALTFNGAVGNPNFIPLFRLTSTTNLRISTNATPGILVGRYTVEEYS